MKKITLSLALLLFTACIGDKKPQVETQNEQNSTITENRLGALTLEQVQLKSALENYFSQLKSLNTENIISMTYPRLFIPINQEKFRDYLNTMLMSSDIQVNSFDATTTKIGEVQPFSDGEYAKISYNSTIVITFINPQLYDTQRKLLILDKILSNKYGRENIRVDSINRNITIKKEERLLAIKERPDDWKFLGDNSEYRRLYPRILPTDLLNRI
jgi:hypothetical protein